MKGWVFPAFSLSLLTWHASLQQCTCILLCSDFDQTSKGLCVCICVCRNRARPLETAWLHPNPGSHLLTVAWATSFLCLQLICFLRKDRIVTHLSCVAVVRAEWDSVERAVIFSPVPTMLEACDNAACSGGCYWVDSGLLSSQRSSFFVSFTLRGVHLSRELGSAPALRKTRGPLKLWLPPSVEKMSSQM